MSLQVKILETLKDIDANQWNALQVSAYPFLRYEFLLALESQGCLGEKYGWLPRHVTLWKNDRLVGASPLYLKFNSYGEFVFDWSWADAYQRNGLAYYPKLVSSSPYTPATGPKLLLHPEAPSDTRDVLIKATLELSKHADASSIHWLFPTSNEASWLEQKGFRLRLGCQFHWTNNEYSSFDHYLESFSAQKRKKVKRERRRVKEANISFRLLDGNEASDADWQVFHQLYESTFDKRGGIPTLSLGFFKQIAETMPESVLLVLAIHENEVVAAAFNLVGEHTLYGRHWGCFEDFHSLHFEACYYQGLEYCIEKGLRSFEPGAQGEHKISRGFLPTETWSAHWISHPGFDTAIKRFVLDEQDGMRDYIEELQQRSPFKDSA